MRRITFLLLLSTIVAFSQETIRVGAKHFNEGYILSELIAQLLEDGGFKVERKFNLGGSTITFEALRTHAIDVYPEYTGTIASEILKSETKLSFDGINSLVRHQFGLRISAPYGFSNTYALLLRQSHASNRNIKTISDLTRHPDLKIGLSYEFIERTDGWKNLAQLYKLPHAVTALEHGLAYEAIHEGKIDVTDAYSTDGEIEKYGLALLADDKGFFPKYEAVSFYSEQLPARAIELLSKLNSAISEIEMQRLNASALFENQSHFNIARTFLIRKGLIQKAQKKEDSKLFQIGSKTLEHLKLTWIALVASMLAALPLGIIIFKRPKISKAVLYLTGILQTVPSIALLALLIPLFGIGTVPAVFALFIYALLPILRNTVVGLSSVDPILVKVANAIGLTPWATLRFVQLPLAAPTILAGIRTAAVINVGTATLAAFIGAGGLGEFIVTGLALNNTNLILMGAIPAALLAVLTELAFEVLELWLVPNHLRKVLLRKP